ncbi:MAG: hypothetical protein SGI89_01020 [bacterium]|nr:hypothetical protein [bacterium]
MKTAYIILYFLSGLVFLIAMLGSSLTKPMFDSISETALETSGFKKSYIQSVDERIDDLVYKSKQIELQIEKLKKFFSSDKVDESKFKREQNLMLEKTFYSPLIGMFNFVFRTGFILLSLIILPFAVMFHLAYRSLDLRKRVRRLESIVNQKTHAHS